MSRYTPKRGRTTNPKPKKRGPEAKKKKPNRPVKPAAFACAVCEKAFRTEEALAIHALDAHGQAPDPATMTPLKPNMVRCPECGAPVRKRNLDHHLRFVHELA